MRAVPFFSSSCEGPAAKRVMSRDERAVVFDRREKRQATSVYLSKCFVSFLLALLHVYIIYIYVSEGISVIAPWRDATHKNNVL